VSKISDEEFDGRWSEGDEFWAWKPIIRKRFKEPVQHPPWDDVQTFKRQIALHEALINLTLPDKADIFEKVRLLMAESEKDEVDVEELKQLTMNLSESVVGYIEFWEGRKTMCPLMEKRECPKRCEEDGEMGEGVPEGKYRESEKRKEIYEKMLEMLG